VIFLATVLQTALPAVWAMQLLAYQVDCTITFATHEVRISLHSCKE